MSRTRQLRLSDQSLIRKRIAELMGKQLNVVLVDGRVVTGELVSTNDHSIVIKNMRLKSAAYPLQDVSEIYLDLAA